MQCIPLADRCVSLLTRMKLKSCFSRWVGLEQCPWRLLSSYKWLGLFSRLKCLQKHIRLIYFWNVSERFKTKFHAGSVWNPRAAGPQSCLSNLVQPVSETWQLCDCFSASGSCWPNTPGSYWSQSRKSQTNNPTFLLWLNKWGTTC